MLLEIEGDRMIERVKTIAVVVEDEDIEDDDSRIRISSRYRR